MDKPEAKSQKQIIAPGEFIAELPGAVAEWVLPHLVAIYDNTPDQIGTGFLTAWDGRPLLVTAKHVLFGHSFRENPLEKQVHVEGDLRTLGQLMAGAIVDDRQLDVAALHINGFSPDRCLPFGALQFDEAPPATISIVGFLARDFRRSRGEGALRPKPCAYTGTSKNLGPQYVGINYSRRSRTTGTKKIEMAPVPRGLSGTVMVSPTALLRNKVEIFGVFTEQRLEQGYVFGAHVSALRPLLNGLLSE